MHTWKTGVLGCLAIETPLFEDQQGIFIETWNRENFIELGLPIDWPQDNIEKAQKNVIRGFHIQRKNPQGKLVRCLRGAVFDVCIDLRKNSKTFLKSYSQVLRGGSAVYLPPGTAHGYISLEDESIVYYKCSTLTDTKSQSGVNWADSELSAPLNDMIGLLRSERDANLPSLKDWLKDPRGLEISA